MLIDMLLEDITFINLAIYIWNAFEGEVLVCEQETLNKCCGVSWSLRDLNVVNVEAIVGLLCPADGASFGKRMHISTHHISLVAGGTQSKMFFGKERRIQGKGEAITPKNSNCKERVY